VTLLSVRCKYKIVLTYLIFYHFECFYVLLFARKQGSLLSFTKMIDVCISVALFKKDFTWTFYKKKDLSMF